MKRRILLVPLAGVMALVLSSCIWPAFRYGPERTGFNAAETTIGTGNVGSLTLGWTADTGLGGAASPAVTGGVLYTNSNGLLQAFSAGGTTGCSGTPKTCTPLWTALSGNAGGGSSPAVSDGVVYVGGNVSPSVFDPFNQIDGTLQAFDAAGSTGCSGTPTVCTPLWTAMFANPTGASPVVADGLVWMSADGLQAFDAAGSTGCSGTPTVCTPLLRSSVGSLTISSPAVAAGVAYQVTGGGALEAFDATGTTGCSGSPPVCQLTWQGFTPGDSPTSLIGSSPAVTETLVYVGAGDGKVRAFKTSASFPQCTGTPKTCNPAWTVTTGGPVASSPAVANGVVYVGSDDDKLYALDATTGAVLWTATTGGDVRSSPTVANGVVYVGSGDATVYAFDATGTTNCSGTPKVCTALWSHTADGAVSSSPVVVNGKLYVSSSQGTLYAFGL